MLHTTMSMRGVLVGLGLGLVTTIACKDDDSVSADDAPEVIANAVCTLYFECECDTQFSSEEACRLDTAAEVQAQIDEGERAGLEYDGTCMDDSLDALRSLGCDAWTQLLFDDPDTLRAFQERLQCKIFYGQRKAGESCSTLENSDGDDCEPGLQCIDEVCRVEDDLADEGEACDDFDDCYAGLTCTDVDGGDDNVCQSLPEAGETCLGMLDLCAFDLYCDQGTKTCQPLPGNGDACAPTGNPFGDRCDAESICNENGTCEPAPTGGEPCLAKCTSGYTCDSGVCIVETSAVCTFSPVDG